MELINSIHGQHECMVSETGEDGLQKHFKHCTKDPNHAHFIPIRSFNIGHLPAEERDTDLYELIKLTAELTVRVRVDKVSPHRPEFWPNKKLPYPFYNMGGSDLTRIGSGEVRVKKYIDGRGLDGRKRVYNPLNFGHKYISEYKSCPCERCEHSDTPSNVWWEITVHTAAHVVFDGIEASHTSCRLFFDSQNSPLVILKKPMLAYSSNDDDRCALQFNICDELGEKLYEMYSRCVSLWLKVLRKYDKNRDNKFTFIVSHPHGCSKQVSVGWWIGNEKVREYNERIDLTRLTYTTSTCPGSSGAMVHCVGFGGGNHVHSGAFDSLLNYSSLGSFCK